jgi:hypothetical protein
MLEEAFQQMTLKEMKINFATTQEQQLPFNGVSV